jgi:hypothetical protein
MLRAESAHITVDGTEYDVVLHVYGERDWHGFLIKPGSQVRIPERGTNKEEVLEASATELSWTDVYCPGSIPFWGVGRRRVVHTSAVKRV